MPAKSPKTANLPAVFVGGVTAFSAAGGVVKGEDGVYRGRFVKDLIPAGTWWKGETAHDVPVERLNHWADTFGKMTAAGVKVPLPLGHTLDPDRNRGYALDMFVGNNSSGTPTLFGAVEIIGKDAAEVNRLAACTEVSIEAEPKLKSGDGTEFTDCISRIAIVTDPVIPKQGGFIPLPLAASRGGGTVDAPCYTRFSQESKNMDWKTLAAALGLPTDSLDDTTGPEAVLAKIKALKGDGETHGAAMAASRKEVETANARIKALEAGKGPAIPADVLDMSADLNAKALDLLVPRIGVGAADKFKALICGSDEKRNPLCLSRASAQAAGLPDSIGKLVLDALAAVVPGPKTDGGKAPLQAFGRTTPGSGGDTDAIKAATDRLVALDKSLTK